MILFYTFFSNGLGKGNWYPIRTDLNKKELIENNIFYVDYKLIKDIYKEFIKLNKEFGKIDENLISLNNNLIGKNFLFEIN